MGIVDRQLQKRKESMDKLFNRYAIIKDEKIEFTCYNCGSILLEHARYCTRCGRKINEDIINQMKN